MKICDGRGMVVKSELQRASWNMWLTRSWTINTMDKLRHKEMKKTIPLNYRRGKYKRRRQLELCKH